LAQIIQEGNRWLVSGDMTMSKVNSLLAEASALPKAAELEIDLTAVSDVDTASISLLFEWLRQARAHKSKAIFTNLPQNLTSLATLYGVLDLIPQSAH
jgi:phospholipid transport system transporter-binding protein